MWKAGTILAGSVFFTALLIEETKGTYLAYFKRNLNPVYLNESIKTAILSQMKKIKIDRKNNVSPKNIPSVTAIII